MNKELLNELTKGTSIKDFSEKSNLDANILVKIILGKGSTSPAIASRLNEYFHITKGGFTAERFDKNLGKCFAYSDVLSQANCKFKIGDTLKYPKSNCAGIVKSIYQETESGEYLYRLKKLEFCRPEEYKNDRYYKLLDTFKESELELCDEERIKELMKKFEPAKVEEDHSIKCTDNALTDYIKEMCNEKPEVRELLDNPYYVDTEGNVSQNPEEVLPIEQSSVASKEPKETTDNTQNIDKIKTLKEIIYKLLDLI